MDQSFHAESSSHPRAMQPSAGGERKRRKSSRMSERQMPAETGVVAAYPGTTNIGISTVLAGFVQYWWDIRLLGSSLSSPSSLCFWTIRPWACWGRRSPLPWILCSNIHFSVLCLSVQIILSQQAPRDERGVVALVLLCGPCSLDLLILSLPCFPPQPLKLWTS